MQTETDWLGQITRQSESWLAPMRRLNDSALDSYQKMFHRQMESAFEYTRMSLDQMRAVAQVHDTASYQAYLEQQSRYAEALRERMRDDAEAFSRIGQEFTTAMNAAASKPAVPAKPPAKAA